MALLRSITGPAKRPAPTTRTDSGRALTIRLAGPDDATALARLAQLDSSRPPRGEVLLAEVAGEPWAAVSLEDFEAIADPFRPTSELLLSLIERGRAIQRGRLGPTKTRRRGLSLRRPRAA